MSTKKTCYRRICLLLALSLMCKVTNAQTAPSCPKNHITAVFAPYKGTETTYNAFVAHVMTTTCVDGVTPIIPWNAIESNSVAGTYSFATVDAQLTALISNTVNPGVPKKTLNLIFAPASEPLTKNGVVTAKNTFTPTYVFSPAWANTVGLAAGAGCGTNCQPQDVVYGPGYPGAVGIGTLRCVGVGTHLNASMSYTCIGTGIVYPFDNTGLPVVTEAPFDTAYKRFIKAVIQHYSIGGPDVPQIGYIRFGPIQGGEIVATDYKAWPNWDGYIVDFENIIDGYDKDLMSYIYTVTATTPGSGITQELADINSLGGISYTLCPVFEASAAVTYVHMGFGTNGVKIADKNSFPNNTASDWGNTFNTWQGHTMDNGSLITLSTQLLNPSDPVCVGTVCPSSSDGEGSLVDILPFINGGNNQNIVSNNFEAFVCDLLLAFSPASTYSTTGCPTTDGCTPLGSGSCYPYTSYAAAYANAFTAYAAGTALSASNTGPICSGSAVNLNSVISPTIIGTYNYEWAGASLLSSSAPSVTATPTITPTDTYTVTAKLPGSGCVAATATTIVTVEGTLTVTPTNNGPSCTGGTVSLSANASGGNGPGSYTYVWTGPSGGSLQSTTGATVSVNPTTTGTATTTYVYSVVVSTTGGCSAVTKTTTVTVSPQPFTSILTTVPAALCSGTAILTAGPVSGGAGTFGDYVWKGSDGSAQSVVATTVAVTPTTTTTYSVTVTTSGSGCVGTSAATTSVAYYAPLFVSAANSGAICTAGTVVETLTATPSGGDGNYTYTWSGSNLLTTTGVSAIATPTTTPGATSTYVFTVTIGSGASGCGTPSAVSTATVAPQPSITWTATPTSITLGESFTVSLTVGGGVAGSQYYKWTGTGITTQPNSPTPPTHFTPTTIGNPGTYAISYCSTVIGCAPAAVTHTVTINPVHKMHTEGVSNTISAEEPPVFIWNLYPNPTKDVVNITATSATTENLRIELSDVTGRTLKTTNFVLSSTQTVTIPVSDLPAGTYLVSLYRNGAIYETKKLVLIK